MGQEKFTTEIAYKEMTNLCAHIFNSLATDISDGMTTVERFHEKRKMTREEAENICLETYDFEVTLPVTSEQHTHNMELFIDLLRRTCAGPPEGLNISSTIPSFFDRLYSNDLEEYVLASYEAKHKEI